MNGVDLQAIHILQNNSHTISIKLETNKFNKAVEKFAFFEKQDEVTLIKDTPLDKTLLIYYSLEKFELSKTFKQICM